jgi:hypothetical protein
VVRERPLLRPRLDVCLAVANESWAHPDERRPTTLIPPSQRCALRDLQQLAKLRVGQVFVSVVAVSHKPQLGGSNRAGNARVEPEFI